MIKSGEMGKAPKRCRLPIGWYNFISSITSALSPWNGKREIN
jgi:hypothetical protein